MNLAEININGEKITLFGLKAITIGSSLIISDIHLGKVIHFRKSGIPVPENAAVQNLERLIDLIEFTATDNVIFLGDLFHSHYNDEWEEFGAICRNYAGINFELVRGNHDILSDYQYDKLNIRVHPSSLHLGNFILSHEPLNLEEIKEGQFNLYGHIHPGVYLNGKARQGLKLPCFYFEENHGIMPAFGAFTGTKKLKPRKNSKVYPIFNDKIVLLNGV